ncbi:DUF6959 family protein [Nocardia sp. NPDC056000]|uniref:DUF6959 family protein n=1 Tax=Nocardia sp. NPDC056000 TaxID=3345674 RepID=UPI0035DBB9DB
MEYDARIFDTQGGYSLVKWEGRKFPGLLVQGDTLWTVMETLNEAASSVEEGNLDDVEAAIQEAREALQSMLESYEYMMSAAGLKLPYFK